MSRCTLPTNSTRRIQPMDAEIIAALKSHYRRCLVFRIFENMDAGAKILYSVDFLTVMRWVEKEWARLKAVTIDHCWRHWFESSSNITDCYDEINCYTVASVIQDVNEQGVRSIRIGIKILLNPVGVDDIIESV